MPATTYEQQKAINRKVKLESIQQKQSEALKKLDKMVQEIYETDLPGMCFMNPPASRSEGNICKSNCSRSVETKCNSNNHNNDINFDSNQPDPCFALYSLNLYFPVTCPTTSSCPSRSSCCYNNVNTNNHYGTPNACRFQAPPPPPAPSVCEHTRTLPQYCHGCGGSALVGGTGKMAQSISFTHAKDHKCCPGYSAVAHHQNGRHHKVHSNACQII